METKLKVRKNNEIQDERAKMISEEKMLENFLGRYFGQKRLLVIQVTTGKKAIYRNLHQFAKEQKIDVEILKGKNLDLKLITDLASKKDKPLMIIVDHLEDIKRLDPLEEATVLRGIIDQVDRGNDTSVLHKNSSFIFLAGEGFPNQEMTTVSLTWAHETAFIDCRDFRTKIITHMNQYKKRVLNLHDQVHVIHREYGHILRDKDYERNFPFQVTDKLLNSKFLKPIKWNRYSHHLNSSQVMTVNFFYPLIRYRELGAFLALAGIEDEVVYDPEHLQFIKTSNKENIEGRKTFFDFYMKLKSGREVFIETRYTEGAYGRANNESHHDKYKELYESMLKSSLFVKEDYKNESFFLEHYNFMRGLVQMDENSTLLLLYPRENWAIREKALFIKDQLITKSSQEQYIPLVWENVLEALMKNIKNNDVAYYYDGWFKDKYFRY